METINVILLIILVLVVIYYIYNLLYYYNGILYIKNFIQPKYNLENKKIAICYSGQIRDGYEQTLLLQKIFLIDCLNPDVFCCFENTTDEIKDFINKYLAPKNISYVNDYVPDKDCKVSLGTMSMYNKIYLANQLKIKYENKNNFKYDYVIRIRPDIIIKEYLPKYIFEKEITNQIYMPIISKMFISYGYPDFMGISTSKNMDIYSNTYIFLVNFKLNVCNISETLLYMCLKQNNIDAIIFEYPIQLYRYSYDNISNVYESIKFVCSLFNRYIIDNKCDNYLNI